MPLVAARMMSSTSSGIRRSFIGHDLILTTGCSATRPKSQGKAQNLKVRSTSGRAGISPCGHSMPRAPQKPHRSQSPHGHTPSDTVAGRRHPVVPVSPPLSRRCPRYPSPAPLALRRQLRRPCQPCNTRLLEEISPPHWFLHCLHRSASIPHRRQTHPQLLKVRLVIQGQNQLHA
jgi:hypothetical protein